MRNKSFNKNHRPKTSLDGILPGRSKGPNVVQSQSRPLSTSLARSEPLADDLRLDDFRRSDGFHPASQPSISAFSNTGTADFSFSNTGRNPKRTKDGTLELSLDEGAKRPKKKQIRRIFAGRRKFLALPAIILLIFGMVLIKGVWSFNRVFKGGGNAPALLDNPDPTQLKGEGDGRINILLLGRGGPGHTAPDLTDTLLIASIDPLNKKAALLSIPRDLWVQPVGMGGMKINGVYANAKSAAANKGKKTKDAELAGLSAIDDTVQRYMGVPIHYHAMVDFTAFKDAINTVGGVDITVTPENTVYERLWDDTSGRHYTLDVKTGPQHFDGTRALFYSRSRQTSPRGDFDRTERQRLIMFALKSKVLSLNTFANPAKISSLTDTFGNHVSFNMTVNEIMKLYNIGKNITSDNVVSLGLADPPNNFVITDNMNGQSIVRPKAGLANFADIQNYVRNALKDGFIAKEDAKILILNGTNKSGFANARATELRSFGYNITEVGTAPTQTYTKTTLIDLRNGKNKYTKSYLEKRLRVTAVNSLPDPKINANNADFVIILGSNETSTSQN